LIIFFKLGFLTFQQVANGYSTKDLPFAEAMISRFQAMFTIDSWYKFYQNNSGQVVTIFLIVRTFEMGTVLL